MRILGISAFYHDSAAALVRDEPQLSKARIAEALDGHLCRCGAHRRIIDAIEEAAEASGDVSDAIST